MLNKTPHKNSHCVSNAKPPVNGKCSRHLCLCHNCIYTRLVCLCCLLTLPLRREFFQLICVNIFLVSLPAKKAVLGIKNQKIRVKIKCITTFPSFVTFAHYVPFSHYRTQVQKHDVVFK